MGNYYNKKYKREANPKDETSKFLDSSVPKFCGKLKPLMTEEQKAAERVPIDELAFEFSCRVTRMYKWLNEGKLSKADRDIVGANVRESKHAQSDNDFLSKMSIAYKEADESDYWLNLLHDLRPLVA